MDMRTARATHADLELALSRLSYLPFFGITGRIESSLDRALSDLLPNHSSGRSMRTILRTMLPLGAMQSWMSDSMPSSANWVRPSIAN